MKKATVVKKPKTFWTRDERECMIVGGGGSWGAVE